MCDSVFSAGKEVSSVCASCSITIDMERGGRQRDLLTFVAAVLELFDAIDRDILCLGKTWTSSMIPQGLLLSLRREVWFKLATGLGVAWTRWWYSPRMPSQHGFHRSSLCALVSTSGLHNFMRTSSSETHLMSKPAWLPLQKRVPL